MQGGSQVGKREQTKSLYAMSPVKDTKREVGLGIMQGGCVGLLYVSNFIL